MNAQMEHWIGLITMYTWYSLKIVLNSSSIALERLAYMKIYSSNTLLLNPQWE